MKFTRDAKSFLARKIDKVADRLIASTEQPYSKKGLLKTCEHLLPSFFFSLAKKNVSLTKIPLFFNLQFTDSDAFDYTLSKILDQLAEEMIVAGAKFSFSRDGKLTRKMLVDGIKEDHELPIIV